jgi:hypothetical protein
MLMQAGPGQAAVKLRVRHETIAHIVAAMLRRLLNGAVLVLEELMHSALHRRVMVSGTRAAGEAPVAT